MEQGRADFGVIGHLDKEPRHRLMEYRPLFSYPFMLVCRLDQKLAARQRIRPRDLVRYPLVIAAEGSRSRTRIDRVFREHGIKQQLKIVLKTTNAAVLNDYLQMGLGITTRTTRRGVACYYCDMANLDRLQAHPE